MAVNNQQSKKQQTEVYRKEGRKWPVLLVLVIAALLVSAAVALTSRWVYREFIKDQPSQNPVPAQADKLPAESSSSENKQSTQTESNSSGESGQNNSEADLPVTGG